MCHLLKVQLMLTHILCSFIQRFVRKWIYVELNFVTKERRLNVMVLWIYCQTVIICFPLLMQNLGKHKFEDVVSVETVLTWWSITWGTDLFQQGTEKFVAGYNLKNVFVVVVIIWKSVIRSVASFLIGMLCCFRSMYSLWWACCGWRFRVHSHGSGVSHLLFYMPGMWHWAPGKTFLCTRREAILWGRLSG